LYSLVVLCETNVLNLISQRLDTICQIKPKTCYSALFVLFRGTKHSYSVFSEELNTTFVLLHRNPCSGEMGVVDPSTVQLRRPALRYMLISGLCACIQIECHMPPVEYCLASQRAQKQARTSLSQITIHRWHGISLYPPHRG
jgi:hypothetical protein